MQILLIDDSAAMRNQIAQNLKSLGLEVTTAQNGREGIIEAMRVRPHLILCDLMMPVMDGLEFLTKLRKDPLHAGLPVFVLTDKVVTDAESEILGELASAVLLKRDAPELLGQLLGSIFNLADAAEG